MRKDGKRVKDADPMYTVVPYIMNKRYDAMNMITLDIPVDTIREYIKEKRREGVYMSHLGVIIAAYLRTAKHYPLLNRFVVNKKIYDRNAFDVAMVVLKNSIDEEGTMSKIRFEMDDDVIVVQSKIDKYIISNRSKENSNSTDKLIKTLLKLPGLCNFGVGMFKFLDKHGWLPNSIIDASPFHTSLTVSNLASIKTNHIYHHVYEFGTTSVFITLGNMREVAFREKGEIVFKKCLPLGVVMDERICSGSYFANAFRSIKAYLTNPRLLEGPDLGPVDKLGREDDEAIDMPIAAPGASAAVNADISEMSNKVIEKNE